LIDDIKAVTTADIQRVAQMYLSRDNRTVGWLLASKDGSDSADPVLDEPAAVHVWGINGPTAPVPRSSNRAPFERRELPSGIILLGQAQPDDPSIVLRFRTGAGATSDSDDRAGVAALTARSLGRGAGELSFDQINERTDGLGASLSVDPSQISVELRIRFLREDLAELVELAALILREPTFPSTEVDKVRAEIIAAIREQDNDTRSVADRSVRKLLYPAGHPLHRRVLGEPDSVNALSFDDLRAFHRQWFGPRNLIVAAVGGFDDLNEIERELNKAFGGWASAATPPEIELATRVPGSEGRSEAAIPGKAQADIAIGFPVVSRLDPTFQALDMANLILGKLGLMGRLGANIRDKQGLAYYAFSSVEAGRNGSVWLARAGVDPNNIDRAIYGVREEVERLRAEPVSDQELDDAKRYLTGVLPLALETNDGVASLLLSIEHFDLGLDYLERYPDIISSIAKEAITDAARANLDPSALQIAVARPEA
jgi:zinc protease